MNRTSKPRLSLVAKEPAAKTGRSKAPRPDAGAWSPPLSVSREALLENGSDSRFRHLLYGLLTIGDRLEVGRGRFGRRIGVTGPQYSILMAIVEHGAAHGVGVSALAGALHVSASYITNETTKLIARGLVEKRVNPADGRGALLTLTEDGRKALHRLAPALRLGNNIFFRSLSKKQFHQLCRLVDALVEDAPAAIEAIDALEEAARRAAAEPDDLEPRPKTKD